MREFGESGFHFLAEEVFDFLSYVAGVKFALPSNAVRIAVLGCRFVSELDPHPIQGIRKALLVALR